MDRHKCKLCFRSFSNGRALGGHMRSHMMNLPLPPKQEDPLPPPPSHAHLSEDAESASFPSSPSSSQGEAEDKGLSYGLRENPKRSIRLVDPEFSFAVDAGSVVLQDRESETESSKNPTRRRSKRTRKPALEDHHHHYNLFKRLHEKEKKLNHPESWTDPEPLSSISGTTTEEDVAFCLMMLSRDKWTKHQAGYGYGYGYGRDDDDDDDDDDEDEEESMEETDDSEALKFPKNRTRGNYKCETCNKVFRSYQALGGHRASHKKIKVSVTPTYDPLIITERENAATTTSASMVERKIHECPVCFRVFSSGQALGGHKRSHVTGFASTNSIPAKTPAKKFGDSLIDLNLPAPFEEEDLSQIELSAVSDADFVNAIRQ